MRLTYVATWAPCPAPTVHSRCRARWSCTYCLCKLAVRLLARSATTGATVVCDVSPELERVPRHADAANSSTGTAAAMKGSDGVDMPSTFHSCTCRTRRNLNKASHISQRELSLRMWSASVGNNAFPSLIDGARPQSAVVADTRTWGAA